MAEVYRRHLGVVARALRSAAFRRQGLAHLNSGLELENAILEVFARAFEPRARLVYDGIRPYEHFLLGIARNYLLEGTRNRERAVGLLPNAEELDESFRSSEDVHQQLEDREVEELLRKFQATLSSEDQQLYQLRFSEGLPQEKAAEQLGVTRIQLRRRELALKRRLLAFLKERGYLRDLTSSGWTFLRQRAQP